MSDSDMNRYELIKKFGEPDTIAYECRDCEYFEKTGIYTIYKASLYGGTYIQGFASIIVAVLWYFYFQKRQHMFN
jgi:hypothetical protein